MSHLLKNKKKQLKIKFIFFFPIFYIFFKTLIVYPGNKLIYIFFSLISFYLIYFSVRKKSLFYETFFFFIFMGFWSKFSLILFLNKGFTGLSLQGQIIFPNNYDDALITSYWNFKLYIIWSY